MWVDVTKELPKNNIVVLTTFLEPFMDILTEQLAIGYYDKKEGWFRRGLKKPSPLSRVIYWCHLPEKPHDPRFDNIPKVTFDSKYSCNTLGNVGPKTVLRKLGGRVEKEIEPTPATPEQLVNLQYKYASKSKYSDQSFFEQIRVINRRTNT